MASSKKAAPPNRLLALDGLRGFAALAVAISHLGFNLHAFTDSPIANSLFRVVSAGPSSVQLFFVLSGFLMAFLYPTIKNTTVYLEKRYLRILPIFGVVVVALWVTFTYAYSLPPLVGVGILLGVALATSNLWKLFLKIQQKVPSIGKNIFISFLLFQAGWFMVSLSTSFGFGQTILESFNEYQKSFFVMLSNLSMTMYWQKDLVVLEGVFWSLVPEMFFYFIYPFLLTPLLALSKRLRPVWNGILVLAVIGVLFQLDLGSRNLFSLHGLFLSRATGFVMGMVVGMMFHNKARAWQVLKKILQHPVVNVALFFLFFIAIAWEWPDRYHQIRQFVMLHYLGLSAIFSLVLASALIPESWVERFFRKKILVFLGMVSYSLYLTHSFVMERIGDSMLVTFFESFLPEKAFHFFQSSFSLLGAILVAKILYDLVEKMYFKHKHVFAISAEKTLHKQTFFQKNLLPLWQKYSGGFIMGTITLALIAFYSTDTVPTILLSREPIVTRQTILTQDQPLTLPFMASFDNLSALSLSLDYAHDPSAVRSDDTQHAELVFELEDEEGNVLIQSVRNPLELEGEPSFPFGFPTQENSKNNDYTISLALKNALPSDEVRIYPQAGIITQSLPSNISNPAAKMLFLLGQRIAFSLQYLPTLFGVALVVIIGFLVWISKKDFSQSM